MNFIKRLKLVASIFLLSGLCFGLVVYENTAMAKVGANSANLVLPTFSVGSEYSGTLKKQYVFGGDTIKRGERLFELKSDQLSAALASGQLKSENLTDKLADDGGLVLIAQHDGILGDVNFIEGSFVPGGKPIAVIKGASSASVKASFELSGPQYAKLQPNTPVTVEYGGQTVTGTIAGITQQSLNGHTFTLVDAHLPVVSRSQTVYSAGTPVIVHLILDTDTLYDRLRRLV